MYRVQGHTIEEQHDLADQFSEVMTHSLDAVTDQLIAHFMPSAVTAAGDFAAEGQAYLDMLWQAQVEGVFSTFIGATYDSAALGLAHDVLGHADLPDGVGVPGLSDDSTASFVRNTANKMKGVSDELWQEISASLAEGVENGESIDQLAERVKAAAAVTTPRALTVARTTVVNASNAGSFAQATLLATDDAMKKQWVATEDLRTRDDHRLADGQTVPLMGKFTVGGWLMDHPGDPDAPAGEVINCRCTLVYDLNEDGPIFTCTMSSAVFTASMATMPGAGTGACVTSGSPSLGGTGFTLPPGIAQSFFKSFQGHQKISPAYGGAKIHKKLTEAKAAYAHVPGLEAASNEDLLDIIDKQYALAGGKSSFKDKYVEWATTGPGSKAVPPGTVKVKLPGTPPHAPAIPSPVPLPPAATGGPVDLLDISSVTPKMQADLWQAFKGIKPVTPNWGGAAIFKNLQAVKPWLGPEFAGLNDGQLLKILDQEWGAKGTGKSFFGETTEWLKTPGAKTYIDKAGLSHASIPDPGLTPATPPLSTPVTTTAVPSGVSVTAPVVTTNPAVASALGKLPAKGFESVKATNLFNIFKQISSVMPDATHEEMIFQMRLQYKNLTKDFTNDELVAIINETAKVKGSPISVTLAPKATSTFHPSGLEPGVGSYALGVYQDAIYAKGYPLPEALDLVKASDPALLHLTDDEIIDVLDFELSNTPGSGYTLGEFKKSLTPSAPTSIPTKVAKKAAIKAAKKAAPTTPASSFSSAAGDITGIPDDVQAKIYQFFKSNGIFMTSTGPKIWDVIKHLNSLKSYEDFTPLQLIRVLDAQGAKKFGLTNTNPFETKMVKWLKTPSGKTYATGAPPPSVIPHKATHHGYGTPAPATPSTPAGSFTLDPIDRPIVTTVETYPEIDTYAAQAMQDKQAVWSPTQRGALSYYTSNNYTMMNGILRGTQPGAASYIAKIRQAQAGMRPSTRAMTLYRGTGVSQFGLPYGAGFDDLKALVGKTMEDKGFMSTSVGSRAAFSGRVILQIEAPTGTPMAFVKSISHYKSENEMLLAAGTRYRVEEVTQSGGTFIVRVRVVP